MQFLCVCVRRDEWLICTCSLGVGECSEGLCFPDRTCCTGGVGLREVPLCIPAQQFIEHMKVLQSFKKGVTYTFCCTPRLTSCQVVVILTLLQIVWLCLAGFFIYLPVPQM
ncbi:hypothetical protein E2C01_014657 [Portunus trituberculatus]|uniref:Uncharacterized protein n=1 Tax=Portunus trituberculatus TaxID=210409 RepID=A0A5B7DKI9_PORTR|nr:hypothetical protein [Portunus trituberculatus]